MRKRDYNNYAKCRDGIEGEIKGEKKRISFEYFTYCGRQTLCDGPETQTQTLKILKISAVFLI